MTFLKTPAARHAAILSLLFGLSAVLAACGDSSSSSSGGGGHLTEGSGISHDELLNRIISSTDKDLRYIIMQHIEQMRIVSPKAKGNWKAVPQDFWIRGRKKDYQIMYDN